ncbi:MAG: hypothetical protein HOG89_05570 [Candidatus Peribacter sp.]|jgi:hypothetical protein|nr:hypothetical protein [Candidatus Peribacter sp.]MBT4392444.1 hypothetical protein [Candidatus Peribacter sp.]MBT4601226.1 hypothetical protein [Candidatus Peribacter sp.]MBT5149275.1 hypothetical protein [Candidatus Peribacter sp.]MBT5637099.1 hypothetical protein [Candidatus Peribacter sp.]
MKRLGLIFVGMILIAPAAHAQTVSADVTEMCKAKYPLPTLEINFVSEGTGHDPRQFLIRRCITTERKRILSERRAQRQQIRDAAHYDRSAARTHQYRIESENNLQDAIRRQNLKEQRFRSRTNLLDPEIFYEGRRSRRSIIRATEGLDRINAIRRSLRAADRPDPCLSVGAIRQFNNPCRNYGSRSGRTQ